MDNPNLAREIILENYKNPQNNSLPFTYTHTHTLVNRTCGDEITVYISVRDSQIVSINYLLRGCAITTASASLQSIELVGKNLTEVSTLDQDYVEELLNIKLSLSRVKCALLPLSAIQQALNLKEHSEVF